MKILIFTENNRAGGMDTFFPTVMKYWPDPDDKFLFVCNASHPGLSTLTKTLPDNCEIIVHHIPLNWTLADRFSGVLPFFLIRVIRVVLRILLVPIQMRAITQLISKVDAQQLLIVNGGYPGGETCRLVGIVWQRSGRGRSVHNIRNFAIKPRFGLRWFENFLDARVARATKAFIGVSKACAMSLHIRKAFAKSDKVHVIYNGLSNLAAMKGDRKQHEGKLRQICNIPNGVPIVLMLATYEPRKGHEFLFKAMQKVFKVRPDTHLVICGDGKDSDRRRVATQQAKYLKNRNVHLMPFQQGGSDLIYDATVLTVPSQEFESFGWVAIEAMARACPVVATCIEGLREVVGEEQKAGYCFATDQPGAFGQQIIDLIQDEALNVAVGQNGLQRVRNMFDASRMAREYCKLVKSLT